MSTYYGYTSKGYGIYICFGMLYKYYVVKDNQVVTTCNSLDELPFEEYGYVVTAH